MKESQEYVLHLASWYPSTEKPQNAIFIKNQVSLISESIIKGVLFCVQEDESVKGISIKKNDFGNLSEYTVNIPYKKGLLRILYFFKAYLKVNKVLKENGKPKLIHVHVVFPIGVIAYVMNLFYRIPYLITEHFTVFCDNSTQKHRSFIINYSRFFSKRARVIQVVSNFLKKQLVNNGFKENKIKVVPNFIDESIFYPPKEKKSSIRLKFLHISSLDPDAKNPEGILQAIKILNNEGIPFKFTIVGSNDSNLKMVKDRARELKIEEMIDFLDSQNQNKIAELMRSHDVFVLNSNYETFSCVVAEAICCGMKVITTDIGGPNEIINDEKLGALFEKNNVKSLVTAMKKLLSMDFNLNKNDISEIGIERYNKSVYVDGMKNLYRRR